MNGNGWKGLNDRRCDCRPRRPGSASSAARPGGRGRRARAGAGPSARSSTAIWAMATARFQASEARAMAGKRPPRTKENWPRCLTTPQTEAGKRPERARLRITSATLSWPLQRLALRLRNRRRRRGIHAGRRRSGCRHGRRRARPGCARARPVAARRRARARPRPRAGPRPPGGGAPIAGLGAKSVGGGGERRPGQLPGQRGSRIGGAEDGNERGGREGRGAKQSGSFNLKSVRRAVPSRMHGKKRIPDRLPSRVAARLPIPRVRDGPPLSKGLGGGLGCALQQSQSSAFISAANRSADGISSSITHKSGSKRLRRAMNAGTSLGFSMRWLPLSCQA